ncbi:MAG: LytR C-terminal domain-containing protein [Gemmatimonadales bacterium]
MEQPRRRLALIIIVVVVSVALFGLSLRRGGDPGEGADPDLPRLVPEGRIVVAEVLNGTPRRGLARLVTRLLRSGGVDVVYFGTAGGPPVALTEVLVRRGTDTVTAARVARALGAGRARIAADASRRVDLTVVLGADYQPPPTRRP